MQTHGGPDAHGAVRWDFSTNVNAAGPCPHALAALQQVDVTRYPDALHRQLRAQLAAWHGVAPARVLLAASGSEFIQRITAVSQRLRPGPVAVPLQAYGDYARAALACGRSLAVAHGAAATLRWCCDPGSPLGQDAPPPPDLQAMPTVLDAVYAPLRLQGRSPWTAAEQDQVFVLHSPNKALGLAGVRAAYAVAPAAPPWAPWCAALDAALPSWPLGAHGVALLQSWASAEVHTWLAGTLDRLRDWRATQQQALAARGIALQPSVTPFFCAHLSVDADHLRAQGLQLRDTTSFGLPGCARLNALPPPAQAALWRALDNAP